jgi:hypothetical protein
MFRQASERAKERDKRDGLASRDLALLAAKHQRRKKQNKQQRHQQQQLFRVLQELAFFARSYQRD